MQCELVCSLATADGISRDTYGITVFGRTIADISFRREDVLALIDKIKTNDLSPIHIDDIVDDYIFELDMR